MDMILPKPIRRGDAIRLICPSGAVRKPESVIKASAALQRLGFRVQVGPGCTRKYGYFGGTDEERAAEVNDAFRDDDCGAILCIRGGYGTARILPMLDYDLIRRRPKRFLGFSDITALHTAIAGKAGVITFHSPMPGFLEDPGDDYTISRFTNALCSPSVEWILENPAGDPPVCVRDGVAEGRITGGNLSLVASLIGTPWEPDYTGRILFLEDVNEHTYRIDGMLTHLRNAGVFEKCAGVCFGQFTDCRNEDESFGFTLREIIDDLVTPAGKPVIMNLRFGHTTPTMTFPVGARAEMQAENGTILLKCEEMFC